jgi:uncharacterized protein (TIGR03084 family)
MPPPDARIAGLLDDLVAEHAALDGRVAVLDDGGWTTATPAEGWAVRDAISHLAFFDGTAALALDDAEAFVRLTSSMAGGPKEPDLELGRSGDHDALLRRWGEGRERLAVAIGRADPAVRVPWYGPPMSLASFVTARLMETWAHGQDVADALGLPPVVSDRLRHVCHIGVGARAYSFRVRGIDDPGDPVRVEAGPWTWGPEEATDRVTGSAIDLALVFTQRRHLDDTSIEIVGPVASQWMAIAQAFAGPAGPGRAPLAGR